MFTIQDIAKSAAERAGKNAGVAPELLYAPILWELQDYAEINRILNMPADQLEQCCNAEDVAKARKRLNELLDATPAGP